jgi:hypothetical protein
MKLSKPFVFTYLAASSTFTNSAVTSLIPAPAFTASTGVGTSLVLKAILLLYLLKRLITNLSSDEISVSFVPSLRAHSPLLL